MRKAADCAQIMAAPFGFASLDDWSGAASESLRQLLGADKSTFAMPDGDQLHQRSDGIPQWFLSTYFEEYLVGDRQPTWRFLPRQLEEGAWNRESVYGENRAEILRSAYWNEIIRPGRFFDTIGLTASVDSSTGVANLQFYHDRKTGPQFGSRGLALLRAVYPSFAAGARSWVALRAHARQLASFVDAMPVGLVLATMDGRIIHENASIRRTLASDTGADVVRIEIRRRIEELRSSRLRDTAKPPISREAIKPLHVGGCSYAITACFLAEAVLAGSSTIAVIVQRSGPPSFPAAQLRERYRLTEREIQVAQLLSAGKTNSEIATTLGVSVFTARHHTENVMLKLDVRARSQVGALLRKIELP
jgi:DNA-binding CsgD family transcriptional regulator/PAS domain-containing protein